MCFHVILPLAEQHGESVSAEGETTQASKLSTITINTYLHVNAESVGRGSVTGGVLVPVYSQSRFDQSGWSGLWFHEGTQHSMS